MLHMCVICRSFNSDVQMWDVLYCTNLPIVETSTRILIDISNMQDLQRKLQMAVEAMVDKVGRQVENVLLT